MRLLFTARDYLPATGGLQESTDSLARRLAAAGHPVGVLTSFGGRRDVRTRLARVGRRIGRPAALHDDELGYPRWRTAPTDPALTAVLDRFPAGLVIAGGGGPTTIEFTTAVLERSGDVPCLLYVRDIASVPLTSLLGPADGVVANAADLARRCEALGRPCPVVPSVIEPAPYRAATRDPDGHVLYINPTPDRGVDIALEVAAARPGVRFVFQQAWAMTDADRAALLARLAPLSNVTFRTPVADPVSLYGGAAALLVPYKVPNRPRVIHEAGLAGIPTVAAEFGGLIEATGPGGCLVPLDAPVDAWAEAIDHVTEDATGAAAAEAAAAHAARAEMDPDALASRVEAIAREQLGQ